MALNNVSNWLRKKKDELLSKTTLDERLSSGYNQLKTTISQGVQNVKKSDWASYTPFSMKSQIVPSTMAAAEGVRRIFNTDPQKTFRVAQDIGYGLRGATNLTPFQSIKPLTPQLQAQQNLTNPTTFRQKTAQSIGQGIYGSILTAPIAGGGLNIVKNAIIGTGLGTGMGVGADILTGKGLPNKERLTEHALTGFQNSWVLPITNTITNNILSKIAPNLVTGALTEPFKQGAVKEGFKRLFLRALAESPAENTAFTFLNRLDDSSKNSFMKDWALNMPGTITTNMAYAMVNGTWNTAINKESRQAVSNALKKTVRQWNTPVSVYRDGKRVQIPMWEYKMKNQPLGFGIQDINKLSPEDYARQTGMSVKAAEKTLKVKAKDRGFVSSVSESGNVSEPVKIKTKGSYIPKANTKLMGEAKALLEDGASIDFKNTKDLDKKVAATIQEALAQDKAGNHEAAANLYNNLARHGTELGRSVQAFNMLDKMSPEAITKTAARSIQKYNETAIRKIPELSGEQQKMISSRVDEIMNMADGREKNIKINELKNVIDNFIPSSVADKAITIWKAGLLTSLRTHERNIIGNTIMGSSEVAKDIPASMADRLMSLKTGKRTLTFTTKGSGEAFSKNTQQQVKDKLLLGYDPSQDITKYDIKKVNWNLKNPVERFFKFYTDTVFNTLSAADTPFFNSAYARSLHDQAGAQAINAGKQGNKAFIKSLIEKPTDEMVATALKDAQVATFKDKNVLSSVAGSIKTKLAGQPKLLGEAGKVVGEVMMPFTGVPSSIVGKTIAYSPLGLVKGAINTGRVLSGSVPELQRQAAQELGRGVMGTALFSLGAYLMSKGLMTGQPKDTKEADLWKLQGKQANSIFINGKWRSINSIGPQNLIMLAGAKYNEEMSKEDGSIGSYAGSLAKDQLSQTFLAGVQGPLNAITDPNRYGKSYLGNTASSTVPNIIKDTSKAFDPSARENNTVKDYLKSSIPGIRNTLLPRRDVLGNIIPQEPTGIGAFIDLFNSKKPIENAVVNELSRLYSVGQEALPSKLTTNQTILKQKVKLTFEQLDNLEAGVGEELKPRLETLINSPTYQRLDDDKKVKAIDKIVQDTRTQYKNINADTILAGKSATGYPQVNTTASSEYQSSANKQDKSKIYSYVDEDGNYKEIDLTPIEYPKLTGNTELDKKIISKYKGKLTTQKNGIVTLYEQGEITADEAEKMLNDLIKQSNKLSSKKGKKPTIPAFKAPAVSAPPKLSIKMPSAPKIRVANVSTPSIKPLTLPKKNVILKTASSPQRQISYQPIRVRL